MGLCVCAWKHRWSFQICWDEEEKGSSSWRTYFQHLFPTFSFFRSFFNYEVSQSLQLNIKQSIWTFLKVQHAYTRVFKSRTSHKSSITFQERDMSWSLKVQGWMTFKLHHELREHIIQQHPSYDSILQVKHHILHHFFYPCCQSDFSKHLQITKCIKSSATHQRNIHMTSTMTPILNFFLL